ncbi:hypothetical protein LXL04_000703 [Taraxacum kok-saghyz]
MGCNQEQNTNFLVKTQLLSLNLRLGYAIFRLMSTPTKPQSRLMFMFVFLFLVFMSICTLKNNPSLVNRCGPSSKMQDSDLYFQEIGKVKSEDDTTSFQTTTTAYTRRKLGGPGSSPPRCAWKCGRCTPCRPVHVPVPPGTPVTAEYYPEAWRCKCKNKLYMP